MRLRVKVLQPPSCRKTKRWRPYRAAQTSARWRRSSARRRVNGERPDYLLEIRETGLSVVSFGSGNLRRIAYWFQDRVSRGFVALPGDAEGQLTGAR